MRRDVTRVECRSDYPKLKVNYAHELQNVVRNISHNVECITSVKGRIRIVHSHHLHILTSKN